MIMSILCKNQQMPVFEVAMVIAATYACAKKVEAVRNAGEKREIKKMDISGDIAKINFWVGFFPCNS